MERLPIDSDPPSHLAVRFDGPDGAATAVLYMHGFGSDQSGTKASFFRQRVLDAGLVFCSFDFQGHGESGGRMFDLTLSRNLEDIGRVHGYLASRGVERVVLMGSSMGGGAALWYAALHPEDVAAGVHIAPSLELADGLLSWVGDEAAARWEREGKLLFEHELVDCEIGWSLIEDLRSYRRDRLKEILRTPTLVLQGKLDTSVRWQPAVELVTGCAYEGLELHLMADADHRMIDRLDHLWRLVHGFLEARGVLGGGKA